MTTRGRPPLEGGAQTPAQRKAAQRARDRAAVESKAQLIEGLTTTALAEAVSKLISERRAARLGVVLVELGRRGGVELVVQRRLNKREG